MSAERSCYYVIMMMVFDMIIFDYNFFIITKHLSRLLHSSLSNEKKKYRALNGLLKAFVPQRQTPERRPSPMLCMYYNPHSANKNRENTPNTREKKDTVRLIMAVFMNVLYSLQLTLEQ